MMTHVGVYNTNNQIKCKPSMLKSNLCDHSDAYILVKGTILVANTVDTEVIFENCCQLNDCISETNNTQTDTPKDIDEVMPMFNLIEYSDSYSNISKCLWQYYRDEIYLDANGAIANFPAVNKNSALFIFKQKITGKTAAGGRKEVETTLPLKYLINVWRTIQMFLIN